VKLAQNKDSQPPQLLVRVQCLLDQASAGATEARDYKLAKNNKSHLPIVQVQGCGGPKKESTNGRARLLLQNI